MEPENNAQVGTFRYTVTATDAHYLDPESTVIYFTVKVLPTNHAPAFASVPENQKIFVSEILSVYLPSFSDIDEMDIVTL